VIEVEVHQQLRELLREQSNPPWAHHLTMARLVARALRLGRSALIQTGTEAGLTAPYRLSYLMPLLLWEGPAIVVAPPQVQQWLMTVELPRLQQWLDAPKAVQQVSPDRSPFRPDFSGISLVTPQYWLRDRLGDQTIFPEGLLTIIDGLDDLDDWVQEVLSLQIQGEHWEQLMLSHPGWRSVIRDLRISITHQLFQHPANPYNCYILEAEEFRPIQQCLTQLAQTAPLPELWAKLLHHLNDSSQLETDRLVREKSPTRWSSTGHRVGAQSFQDPGLLSAKLDRQSGLFTLQHRPIRFAPLLEKIWPLQPTVFIGSALDLESTADIYRQTHGLSDLTCLKFSPARSESCIQLYQPDRIPMPNTPQFQPALLEELRQILARSNQSSGLIVILIGDNPLRSQVGAKLASECGSRVQVDRLPEANHGILVTGWTEWHQLQVSPPNPQPIVPTCIVIATLPMPSLEDPIVAARVQDYKRLRQDWFRLYLLPAALMSLQRAIFSLRSPSRPHHANRGLVALLDSRVMHRNYGQQVLMALSPYARVNYLDESWGESDLWDGLEDSPQDNS
jgi:ATP-dependent DNA helicase DinG